MPTTVISRDHQRQAASPECGDAASMSPEDAAIGPYAPTSIASIPDNGILIWLLPILRDNARSDGAQVIRPCGAVLLLGALLALGGCGARDPGPADLQPGSMDAVTRQAEGFGMAEDGRDPILDMGMIAMDHWVQPSVPVIKNARAINAWFYPQKLADGRTLRDGFYAYHVIEDFSWGMWDAMHRDAINLQALGSISVDEDGGLKIDPSHLPPGAPTHIPERKSAVEGIGAKHYPYTSDADGETDVIVVDENSGSVTQLRTPSSPVRNRPPGEFYGTPASSGVRTGPGEVDLDAVRDLIQKAQSQARQMAPQQRPPAMPTPDGGLEMMR